MHTSERGLRLIKEFEGCRLKAYQDIAGVWTIGWGTTNADKEVTGTEIREGLTITQETADEWLRYTLERKYEPLVIKYDGVYSWTQPEFDALVSFAYNLGSIKGLTNDGRRSRAQIADVWTGYCHAGGKVVQGLVDRRNKELQLFLSGEDGEAQSGAYDRDRVIEIARAEVGYLEKSKAAYQKYGKDILYKKTDGAGSDNFTKYGYEMHKLYPQVMDFPAPWCDALVDWCFLQAYGVTNAKKLLAGNFDDYTPASAQLYKDKKSWKPAGTIPERGWQVFFKNTKRICHTGLVVDVVQKDGIWYIITVEGNTTSEDGVVANGGCVRIKQYRVDYDRIAGYGVPPYGDEHAAAKIAFAPHWVRDDAGVWYYRTAPGKNAHGWLIVNCRMYFFDNKGRMLTGCQKIEGERYYFATAADSQDFEGAMMLTRETGELYIWTN